MTQLFLVNSNTTKPQLNWVLKPSIDSHYFCDFSTSFRNLHVRTLEEVLSFLNDRLKIFTVGVGRQANVQVLKTIKRDISGVCYGVSYLLRCEGFHTRKITVLNRCKSSWIFQVHSHKNCWEKKYIKLEYNKYR